MKNSSIAVLLLLPLLVAPILLLPPVGRAQSDPQPTPIFVEPTIVLPGDGVSEPDPDGDESDEFEPSTDLTSDAFENVDACEPNERRTSPCALSLDAINGPYALEPVGDQDWFRVELPTTQLQTEITVRSTDGLDLLTTINHDDGTPLGTVASPAISSTLAPDVAGGVLLRVENRNPYPADGEHYNIEIRRVLPPPPTPPTAEERAELPPDDLEDNWSPAAAAPIGVGVAYELNFVCPVAWGCPGGDHDYLRLPVKAGVRYLISTFDLGPGVDTVLELFWGDETQPLATNDDARAGASFLSVLRWVAPADGEAILRIGPRAGGLSPIVPDENAGTYRLAVALAESDLAQQLEDRIADQTNAPSPTPSARPAASTGGSSPAAAAPEPVASIEPTISTDAPTGAARVRAEQTALRESPSAAAPEIQSLPAGAVVTLLGQSSGSWVRVQPDDGVLPGWVRGADLTREPEVEPTAASSATETPTSSPTTASVTPTPARLRLVAEPLDPLPPAPAPAAAQRVTVALSVEVATAPRQRAAGRLEPTPRPADLTHVAGARVQLVSAFGDVLAEAITPATGRVDLITEVAPTMALFITLPAAGLRVPVDLTQPGVLVVLPSLEEPSR